MVQVERIREIRERTEDFSLGLGRVGKHAQRLIRMRGHDDVIERVLAPGRVADQHAVLMTADPRDLGGRSNARAEIGDQAPHVLLAAASNRSPMLSPPDREVSRVLERADECCGVEVGHRAQRQRPQRGGDRQNEIDGELTAIALAFEVLADRQMSRAVVPVQQFRRLSKKPKRVDHHAAKFRRAPVSQ